MKAYYTKSLTTIKYILLLLITFSLGATNPDTIEIEVPYWYGKPLRLCNPIPGEEAIFYPNTVGRKSLREKPITGIVVAVTDKYLYFSGKLKYEDTIGTLYSKKWNCAIGFAIQNTYFNNKFFGSKFILSREIIKEITHEEEEE